MTEYSVKPGKEELETARKITEKGLDKASKLLPKDECVSIGLGWTGDPFVEENMDGVAGKSYGSGHFHISFNTTPEKWKKALLATAVHEYGHTWFYENIEDEYTKVLWQYILDEALTQNLASKLAEYRSPWRTEHSESEISEHWEDIRENISREVTHPDPLYINQDEDGDHPNWLGYSLSYYIGKKLLETRSLEEFPELTKKDVLQAGDELFGEDR
ncbi:DUF2268 domain-containing putative Zn-dependent protease [Candidatus Nanohalococcus occultus]|uniref:DUF2268 domain-containing protein n=1 Tax=Candidatus Nanohalococcus occultus TaxID=2978047 RepID=A0ABY8CD80_9ARCH|nr:hypothetical protein SVXNc_0145 [Candidatus Nanohaloarchaeota archaeon SVXNc]